MVVQPPDSPERVLQVSAVEMQSIGRPIDIVGASAIGGMLFLVYDVEPYEGRYGAVRQRRWAAYRDGESIGTSGIVSSSVDPLGAT